MSLCYRCQHRVDFFEKKFRPRFECGSIEQSKYSCYMFSPIQPIVQTMLNGDKRPPYPAVGWMLSGRTKFECVDEDMELTAKKNKKGFTIYWKPKEKTKKRKR